MAVANRFLFSQVDYVPVSAVVYGELCAIKKGRDYQLNTLCLYSEKALTIALNKQHLLTLSARAQSGIASVPLQVVFGTQHW